MCSAETCTVLMSIFPKGWCTFKSKAHMQWEKKQKARPLYTLLNLGPQATLKQKISLIYPKLTGDCIDHF